MLGLCLVALPVCLQTAQHIWLCCGSAQHMGHDVHYGLALQTLHTTLCVKRQSRHDAFLLHKVARVPDRLILTVVMFSHLRLARCNIVQSFMSVACFIIIPYHSASSWPLHASTSSKVALTTCYPVALLVRRDTDIHQIIHVVCASLPAACCLSRLFTRQAHGGGHARKHHPGGCAQLPP